MSPFEKDLRQFVIDNFLFGRTDNSLSADDSLLEKGLIDSTGILELVAFLEQRYGIKIQDEDVVPENMDSINRLSAFIGRKLQAEERIASAS